MGREKKADRREVRAPEGRPQKKPYTKPALRRLGTVSELTQMGTPYTK
jgi:hypothetical protein